MRHYDANYGNFQTRLYEDIRKEAYGEDMGQNSWITTEEQDHFIPWLNLCAGKVLLDVACGSGGPAMRIAEKTGCSLVGIDMHDKAISTAKALAAERKFSDRTQFQMVDAGAELDFADAMFDAISCIDSINHLPDRPRVLEEWKRVLKPGGRLLFTDPITMTGPLSASEISVRSSSGYFLFVPAGYDEQVLSYCGFHLLWQDDVSSSTTIIAERRRAARESRSAQLIEIEGQHGYETQQHFLMVASQLARERRLSRFVFAAEKL